MPLGDKSKGVWGHVPGTGHHRGQRPCRARGPWSLMTGREGRGVPSSGGQPWLEGPGRVDTERGVTGERGGTVTRTLTACPGGPGFPGKPISPGKPCKGDRQDCQCDLLAGPSSRRLSQPRPWHLTPLRLPGPGAVPWGTSAGLSAGHRERWSCHSSEAGTGGACPVYSRATATLFPGGPGGPCPLVNDYPSAPEVGEACPGPLAPQSKPQTPKRRWNRQPQTNTPPPRV